MNKFRAILAAGEEFFDWVWFNAPAMVVTLMILWLLWGFITFKP